MFVGAFPTGDLAERIQAVRLAYDAKTAVITPPHVTLAGTYWRTGPATAVNETALIDNLHAQIDGNLPAFQLILGGIRTFGQRVVYLGVEETPDLLAVRRQLLQIAGPDKHRQFTPHLTLAMRLKPDRVQEMVASLQAAEWENGRFHAPISHLQLMQRGPQDPAWRTIARVALRNDG